MIDFFHIAQPYSHLFVNKMFQFESERFCYFCTEIYIQILYYKTLKFGYFTEVSHVIIYTLIWLSDWPSSSCRDQFILRKMFSRQKKELENLGWLYKDNLYRFNSIKAKFYYKKTKQNHSLRMCSNILLNSTDF